MGDTDVIVKPKNNVQTTCSDSLPMSTSRTIYICGPKRKNTEETMENRCFDEAKKLFKESVEESV